MEHDQAHASQHPPLDPLDHRVVDLGMGAMAPPEQDVGLIEPGRRQAMLGLVEGRGIGGDAMGRQACLDRAVDAIRIELLHGFGLPLVAVLVPDDDLHRGAPAGGWTSFGISIGTSRRSVADR